MEREGVRRVLHHALDLATIPSVTQQTGAAETSPHVHTMSTITTRVGSTQRYSGKGQIDRLALSYTGIL